MRPRLPILLNLLRGFLMGTADVVPGVSGGTVALIVGVYERLVTAISRFDLRFVDHLRRRELSEAMQRIDLPFLLTLGSGIVVGIVSLGSTMESLLLGTMSRPLTLAAFLGMIVASSVLVARWVEARTTADKIRFLFIGLISASLAFWITGLNQTNESPDITLNYVFLCGIIGICAMILPGLSGAYLLLVLEIYSHLTSILHRLVHGGISRDDIVTVVVFGSGCALGLVSFSKVLKWLLANHRRPTMAVLSGFMVGALRKVWPFQRDLTLDAKSLEEKVYEPVMPTAFNDLVWYCMGVALLAAVLVFTIDYIARRQRAADV